MKELGELLEIEARACFNFFWEQANTDPASPGYGLIVDITTRPERASIASVGFGLTAIVIGVERGFITYEEGYKRTLGTLKTLAHNVANYRGFYAHFVDINTGRNIYNSEYSTIDTAILVNGAVVSGEYFGGEVKELSDLIYERIDWQYIVDDRNKWFYMHIEEDGKLVGHWDYFAEQLMMYILAAGSPTSKVGPELYYRMGRLMGDYNGDVYVRSWHNALFTYQFSHAWFDSARYVDRDGFNWFDNSVKATLANRKYCIDNPEGFKTYGENSWGLTACSSPSGYSGRFGISPSGLTEEVNKNDGTVPPCGPAGSIPFTPEESIAALQYMYESFPELWGRYGFYDAYNLEGKEPWFAKWYIGINKGITLIMIENYRSGLIWNLYMENDYIKEGLENLMFKEIASKISAA